MPGTLEERVAYLEGKVEEHSRGYGDIREGLQHLDQRFTYLDQKVDRFREELMGAFTGALAATNGRIDSTNGRIDVLDQRLSGRIEALDQKVSTQFRWLVGIQLTVLLAVIGALIAK